ncbi:hypothetical protein Cflav_PD2709 [Pedosphaera parvula Ellin514]|uniref:Uncharacterized protein n=1 Tax=Pedosphaera parvula (strain Ellin514) TaxID=320771 RepID=B9XJM9_PEDPL|nr:hypothetical protein Cflav_PD2709 [Pedosphaera parvula Ellin514]
MPGTKVTPFETEPLCPATLSTALPSPGHQATRPLGGGMQFCAGELFEMNAVSSDAKARELLKPCFSVRKNAINVS